MTDHKPYSTLWSRKRELKQLIYSYLEDTEPSVICSDLKDIVEEWVNDNNSRLEKGKVLQSFFKNND